MTKFKCSNCGRIVKSDKNRKFSMEQIIAWNKQCKQCNDADVFEYNKRSNKIKTDIDQFGEGTRIFNDAVSASVIGLIGILNTSNDMTKLFN